MNKKVIIAGLLMLLFLGSCRGIIESKDPLLQLRERVEGFIEARQNAKLTLMQSYYLSPEKARIATFTYEKSEIVAIDMGISMKSAEVKIDNTIKVMGFTFKKLPQTMHWVWHANEWFYSPSENRVNPFVNSEKLAK